MTKTKCEMDYVTFMPSSKMKQEYIVKALGVKFTQATVM